jgi:hypothetical protein
MDYYVQVNLYGFYTISNALGGVEINLCEAQQDSYSGIDLQAGPQTIQGTQALAFVRQRHGLDAYGGDIAREKRQQYFLSQVFKQVQSAGTLANPVKLQNLLSAVSGALTISDGLDPLQLAKQMSSLTAGNITMSVLPTLGSGTSPDGQSIENVDFDAIPSFIAQVIGATDPKLGTAVTVAPSAVTVAVQNGSGTSGIAAANAAALQALGFQVGPVGDASSQTASTLIQYPDGMQSQAKTLAAQVPGAVLVLNNQVTAVTLVIGTNNVQVSSLMPAASSGAAPTPTPSDSDADNTGADGTRSGADDSCIN